MHPRVTTFTTDWDKPRDKNVWRRSVAVLALDDGGGLPAILRVIVVEIPGDMDPETVTVTPLRVM